MPLYKFLLVGLVAVLILFLGCTQQTQSPSSLSQPTSASNATSNANTVSQAVIIKDFQFSPDALTVVAGTKVTWTNKDSVPHTVTGKSGNFDSKSMGSGASFSYQFDVPGTYEYYCAIHPSMVGKIIVAAK